jgi:shikimate dehydrogenase
LDKAAELIGAVNTIKFGEDGVEGKEVKGHNGNGAKGYNTNGLGAVAAIEEVAVVKNNKVVILGAGGASRAVSFQILLNGAGKLVIANRTPEKALVLKENLDTKLGRDVSCTDLGEGLKEELKDADILINTTPIGMHPNVGQEPLVKADMMPEGLVVNDIIYNPLETSLLREARKAGATPVSGTKMLIYQGMEAFRIWTGIKPPFEVFEAALMKELNPA